MPPCSVFRSLWSDPQLDRRYINSGGDTCDWHRGSDCTRVGHSRCVLRSCGEFLRWLAHTEATPISRDNTDFVCASCRVWWQVSFIMRVSCYRWLQFFVRQLTLFFASNSSLTVCVSASISPLRWYASNFLSAETWWLFYLFPVNDTVRNEWKTKLCSALQCTSNLGAHIYFSHCCFSMCSSGTPRQQLVCSDQVTTAGNFHSVEFDVQVVREIIYFLVVLAVCVEKWFTSSRMCSSTLVLTFSRPLYVVHFVMPMCEMTVPRCFLEEIYARRASQWWVFRVIDPSCRNLSRALDIGLFSLKLCSRTPR